MLPKIDTATFNTFLPIAKQKIMYRPYTIKEEKILLIALKSEDTEDMVRAVKQVVNNCVLTKTFDIEVLHTFDLEFLLVHLRIVSVSNELELSFKDEEDERMYGIKLDLPTILEEMVNAIDIPDSVVMLNDTVGVEMKDITIDMLLNNDLDGINDPLRIYKVLPQLMKHVFDKDKIYKFDDAAEEEIEEFFDSFDKTATKRLSAYFEKVPRLSYTVNYTNSKGTVRTIELNGLSDFFQLA